MAVQTITKDVTANRNLYIGGSDIAVVMGESRYKTPLQLWLEKTGKTPAPDLSNNQAVRMGVKLEQVVADLFTEETGKIVRQAPKVYQHKEYPYMVAHIDRLVQGTDELLECKTTNAFKSEEWEDFKIPNEYILQVQWYLGITGRTKGYVAVLIGGQQFKYSEVNFDEDLFNLMVESAKDFWNKVQNDIAPELTDGDDVTMKQLYGNSANDFIVELFPDTQENAEMVINIEETIAYRQQLVAEKLTADKEIKAIDAKLQYIMQKNLGLKTPNWQVTWKTQKGGYVYDREQMITDGVFDKYASQCVFRKMNYKNLNKKAGK